MGAVSRSLITEARRIFSDLGYDVTEEGEELRAERKWQTVHVTSVYPETAASHGNLRCFVACAERATEVRERLLDVEPDYDWAVISIDEDDYRVLHPGPDVLPAP
jgi:hypothetical protein